MGNISNNKKENARNESSVLDKFYKLLVWNIFVSILIAFQNTVALFDFTVMENLIRIGISLCAATIFIRIAYLHRISAGTANTPSTNTNDDSKFYPFCKEFELTIREQHILALMLKNMTNQDISNELVISLGTVKTHSHNIFQKLDVSRRAEVLDLYREYKN